MVTDDDDVDEQFIEYELTAEDQEDSNVQDSVFDEPPPHAKVKNKTEKKIPKLSNKNDDDVPSDNHESSSITSSSTLKSSSKKSKRKKGRHKKSSRSKSCYYCDNVCEYHMEKIKQKHGSGTGSSKKKKMKNGDKLEKEMINEGVQVGNSNAKYGHGHYLFDPTQVIILTF